CQDPACQEKLKGILREQTQQAWNLRIEPAAVSATTPSVTVPQETDNSQPRDRRQRDEAAAAEEPLVKRAREVLDAKIVRVDEGFGAAPPVSSEVAEEMAPEETYAMFKDKRELDGL